MTTFNTSISTTPYQNAISINLIVVVPTKLKTLIVATSMALFGHSILLL
jgi:hypothetical protein